MDLAIDLTLHERSETTYVALQRNRLGGRPVSFSEGPRSAAQALGVGESPLMTGSEHDQVEGQGTPNLGPDVLDDVTERATHFAEARGAENVGTTDILFAVFDVYGKLFDRVLYMRGTSRDELIERLAADGVASRR